MSDICPIEKKCARCGKLLTVRDFLRDSMYCKECKLDISLSNEKTPPHVRRSSRIRKHQLEQGVKIKEDALNGLPEGFTKEKKREDLEKFEQTLESVEKSEFKTTNESSNSEDLPLNIYDCGSSEESLEYSDESENTNCHINKEKENFEVSTSTSSSIEEIIQKPTKQIKDDKKPQISPQNNLKRNKTHTKRSNFSEQEDIQTPNSKPLVELTRHYQQLPSQCEIVKQIPPKKKKDFKLKQNENKEMLVTVKKEKLEDSKTQRSDLKPIRKPVEKIQKLSSQLIEEKPKRKRGRPRKVPKEENE
ncbi:hypothetical protein EIN_061250 [Entamoeba invadens IP1]|uniref:hypothetical protein n=1 Tax=Entamoeba invadens IP1 TaxID=370355 RepID=UPI0002C3EA8F|nr:hypothetical protein EIN_061250 [Entamoeba invadens IP1]ELP93560.1 hypothetical protein EIN_061250 [Entamoeba invadens IP1]|eukprot:XP_004260331.1 hypothetical protein EIN_061250 [Entamoeba invadens IP1]